MPAPSTEIKSFLWLCVRSFSLLSFIARCHYLHSTLEGRPVCPLALNGSFGRSWEQEGGARINGGPAAGRRVTRNTGRGFEPYLAAHVAPIGRSKRHTRVMTAACQSRHLIIRVSLSAERATRQDHGRITGLG